MKKLLIALAFTHFCVLQIFAQESSVKILLNEEERFRFDSIRLSFINSGHHVMIGDSTGMDNYSNSQTVENTFLGFKAGSSNQDGWNTFLGARAGELHKGGYDNVYVGAWAGQWDSAGYHNTFVGANAGWQNKTGYMNAFVGRNSGMYNNNGRLNSFFGRRSGEQNTSGSENTFIGTSAGANCHTGSYNTFLGRAAGLNNLAGDSNVFIGYFAGADDTSTNRLIIANSNTPDPLIFGDFKMKTLKFNADLVQTTGSVHSSGEIRTDQQFNASGNPGITDTVNSITDIDFSQQKFRYQTTVYSGGIATFISLESEWVDTIIENLVPCGEIGLVGEFNNWTDDVFLARNDYNPDLWTLSVKFTIADDQSEPVDSIVEVKFREDGGWDVNWGSTEFPAGTGYQGGENIPVTLSDSEDTTIHFINFNCRTGAYLFTDLTGYCGDSVTDPRDGKKYATVLIGNQCWMAQDLNIGTRIDGSSDQTNNQTIEKYCYDNLESNCTQWGGLYQRPELMQYIVTPGTKGICMDGWHVPTDEEFKILEGTVDSQFGLDAAEWNKTGWRGYDAGLNLRAATGWSGSENGTDAFGFHAVPGGYLIDYDVFTDGGACLNYQTSSSDSFGAPVIRHINGDFNQITRNTNPADDGCSLRCLKD